MARLLQTASRITWDDIGAGLLVIGASLLPLYAPWIAQVLL